MTSKDIISTPDLEAYLIGLLSGTIQSHPIFIDGSSKFSDEQIIFIDKIDGDIRGDKLEILKTLDRMPEFILSRFKCVAITSVKVLVMYCDVLEYSSVRITALGMFINNQ